MDPHDTDAEPQQRADKHAGVGSSPEPAFHPVDDASGVVTDDRWTQCMDGELDLSGFLPFECVLLKAYCPQHSQVQLVLDPSGRVHLLMHHTGLDRDDREGAIAGRMRMRASVADLIEVRDWVHRHFDLLKLTASQYFFDHRVQPQMHLFTDQAKAGVSLVGQLGPLVRVHLLQRVHAGGGSEWISTELN